MFVSGPGDIAYSFVLSILKSCPASSVEVRGDSSLWAVGYLSVGGGDDFLSRRGKGSAPREVDRVFPNGNVINRCQQAWATFTISHA